MIEELNSILTIDQLIFIKSFFEGKGRDLEQSLEAVSTKTEDKWFRFGGEEGEEIYGEIREHETEFEQLGIQSVKLEFGWRIDHGYDFNPRGFTTKMKVRTYYDFITINLK